MKTKKTVNMMVFDLDGTVARSLDDLTDTVNYAMGKLKLPSIPASAVRTFVGDGTLMLVRRALRFVGSEDADFEKRAHELFKEYYQAHCMDKTIPYPGVEETLEHFKGKVLAVSTNKPHNFARQILEKMGLADRFADILGDGNTARLKPDPCALEYLMEKHGVKPDKTVMVGDGRNDILCARNAGTLCCAVGYGTTDADVLLEMKPDFFCDTFSELQILFE